MRCHSVRARCVGPSCEGAIQISKLEICGDYLATKWSIWGYYIEVYAAERLLFRTPFGEYDEDCRVWKFPGAWIIPGPLLQSKHCKVNTSSPH